MRTAVAARFSVQLPATATFDHPTPAALAAFVVARLAPPPRPHSTAGRGAPLVPRRQLADAAGAGGGVTHVVAAATRFPGAEPGAHTAV